MPQGQFTTADLRQAQPHAGRFSATDVDAAAAPQAKSDGFWLDLAHRLVLNNPVTAGKGIIGAGGVVEGAQPEGEFKWSDVHPSLHNLIQNMADELKRTFAPNAGTAVGNLITAVQAARPVAPSTIASTASSTAAAARPLATTALRTASDILDPDLVGSFSPRAAHLQRLAGKAADVLDKLPAKQQPTPVTTEPAESVYPEAQQNEPENVEPTALEQAKARFQAAQQQQPSTQTPESYPNGVQKRPTDRAEILDDKAVREQMQKDLGLQGYRGAREVGEENAPVPKWQQVAQAKAQSVIDSAHEQAAQILADAEKAATTPAKLTKTVAPKAAAASQAEPVAEDLNSPDRLIDLMQQSIDRLKAAKGK